mgnify:CR=1 FL=1
MGKKITDEIIKTLVEQENYKLNNIRREKGRCYITVTCPNNHTYEKRLDGFKAGDRCKECIKLSYEEVYEIFKKEGYILESKEYINSAMPLKIICPKGHHTEMQLNNFKQGKRCKYCAGNQKHTNEYVKERIEEIGYKLLSEYINESSKILVQCEKNHKPYETTYGTIRGGHRCPYCSRSIGEETIIEILNNNNIKYETQKWFSDCKFKSYLYFDFYLPDINTCIEYDGRQHFEPVNFGNSSKKEVLNYFEETKIRDGIKNDYCKNNNIKLIRIPYTKLKNIENILKEESII